MTDIMPAQADLLTYGFSLIAILVAAVLLYSFFAKRLKNSAESYQEIVKREWHSTGRIDFSTPSGDGVVNDERPQEFRLLVEEQKVVESIAGSENLEIQWRHATLREAKAVVTQYHRYLSDNSLLNSGLDMAPASLKKAGTEGNGLLDLSHTASPPLSPRVNAATSDVDALSIDHR